MNVYEQLAEALTAAGVEGQVRLIEVVPANRPNNPEPGWQHQKYRYDLSREGQRMWGYWRAGIAIDPKDCTLGRIVDDLLSDAAIVENDELVEVGLVNPSDQAGVRRQTESLKRVLGPHYERLLEMDRG